jgi:hypothetical protein
LTLEGVSSPRANAYEHYFRSYRAYATSASKPASPTKKTVELFAAQIEAGKRKESRQTLLQYFATKQQQKRMHLLLKSSQYSLAKT